MGVVEAAVFATCAAWGVDAPTAMALVLLRRLRSGLWIGLGLLLARTVLAHGKSCPDPIRREGRERLTSGSRSAGLAEMPARSAISTLRIRPILNTPWA
jgi:hypothetical protein